MNMNDINALQEAHDQALQTINDNPHILSLMNDMGLHPNRVLPGSNDGRMMVILAEYLKHNSPSRGAKKEDVTIADKWATEKAAFARGEVIQAKVIKPTQHTRNLDWFDLTTKPDWDPSFEYRVKPRPVTIQNEVDDRWKTKAMAVMEHNIKLQQEFSQLKAELGVLRTAFGLRPEEKVVLGQNPQHGSLLVDVGSTRKRCSPVNDEIIRLQSELAQSPKWIPYSERQPTKKDVQWGEWVCFIHDGRKVWNNWYYDWTNTVQPTYWLYAPTPSSDLDDFEKWREEYFKCHPSKEHALRAWQAARQEVKS